MHEAFCSRVSLRVGALTLRNHSNDCWLSAALLALEHLLALLPERETPPGQSGAREGE